MGIPSPRSGFGYEKAQNLCRSLERYVADGRDTSRFAFIEGVSILDAYVRYTDNDCSELAKPLTELKGAAAGCCAAGTEYTADMEEIYNQLDADQIRYFISSRHSIRSYEDRPVEDSVIKEAIELAAHAPSACNRQPEKVYFTSDPKSVDQIKMLIPGNKGFEDEIHNWAIVTEDRLSFGVTEPLQWYVNGGIFLAYFVESLHAYGIGSCVFQIPSVHENTPKIRKLCSVPEGEAIIAAVGLGYPKKENRFLSAARRPADEILVKF